MRQVHWRGLVILGVIPMKNKKNEYKNLYEEVRRISNTHDLMGLIRIGSPDDEYDPETSEILPLIDKSKNVAVHEPWGRATPSD